MNGNRHVRVFIRLAQQAVLAGLILAAATAAAAAGPKTVVIYTYGPMKILDDSIAGIKAELVSEGFTGGKVKIVEVSGNGQINLLDAYTREILTGHPDLIVPVSTPVAQSVVTLAPPGQQIVFSTVTDPTKLGMDHHPANLTGVSDAVNYDGNIKLIRELLPRAHTIGIIYNAGESNSQYGVDKVKVIADRMGLQLKIVTISNSSEVADAARSLAGAVDAIYVGSDNTVASGIAALIAVANERRIPVIASDEGSVENGALAAISVDYARLGRQVGRIVGDILRRGAKAGTIKNVFFYGNALVLNQDTAKRIGFAFSPQLRARALRVVGAR